MRWLICWVSVCVIVVTRDAIAQATGVAMEGVVFDSLRMQPLAGALVGVVGAGSTTTDARGRFRISDIAAGERTVVVAHALLDTIGISTLVRRVRVNGRTRVTVAIPSFSTLWKLACGEAIPHKDHGFIYGSIRDADGEPVVSARIELSWIQTSVDGKKHIRQQQLRSQTVTDSSGSYGVCGVPASTAIRVQASAGGSTSGEIDIFPSDLRAIRQDLVMGPADTAARGVIVGTLTDPAGQPLRDARILVDDAPEVRSGENGRFTLPNMPVGTRQIEVLSIGMLPTSTTVEVRAGDSTIVALQLAKVTTLAVVNVTASRRGRRFIADFEERRLKGMGYVRDSISFAGAGTMASVFTGFPSLSVHTGRVSSNLMLTFPVPPRGRPSDPMDGKCPAALWIDRIPQRDYSRFATLRPDDIAAIEVYPRRFTVPLEFSGGFGCGAVIVWTKYAFR